MIQLWYNHNRYGVATTSRLLKIIGLFCKRALWKRRYSAKETYNFKEPTNRSHPIAITLKRYCQNTPAIRCYSATHGGDQTSNIWISRSDRIPVSSSKRWGLLSITVKTCFNFWGLPWKFVWNVRGLLGKVVEILAVVIISQVRSPPSVVWYNQNR